MASQRKFLQLYDPVWLEERYCTNGETVGVIARSIGCSSSAVSLALRRVGIERTHNARGNFLPRHGHVPRKNGQRSPSPTYRSWGAMITRCSNPNVENYVRYGGRGITVCQRWRDFANFLADMGERPEDTSIDRIDVNGDYEPGNCRWATAEQQRANRRR